MGACKAITLVAVQLLVVNARVWCGGKHYAFRCEDCPKKAPVDRRGPHSCGGQCRFDASMSTCVLKSNHDDDRRMAKPNNAILLLNISNSHGQDGTGHDRVRYLRSFRQMQDGGTRRRHDSRSLSNLALSAERREAHVFCGLHEAASCEKCGESKEMCSHDCHWFRGVCERKEPRGDNCEEYSTKIVGGGDQWYANVGQEQECKKKANCEWTWLLRNIWGQCLPKNTNVCDDACASAGWRLFQLVLHGSECSSYCTCDLAMRKGTINNVENGKNYHPRKGVIFDSQYRCPAGDLKSCHEVCESAQWSFKQMAIPGGDCASYCECDQRLRISVKKYVNMGDIYHPVKGPVLVSEYECLPIDTWKYGTCATFKTARDGPNFLVVRIKYGVSKDVCGSWCKGSARDATGASIKHSSRGRKRNKCRCYYGQRIIATKYKMKRECIVFQ